MPADGRCKDTEPPETMKCTLGLGPKLLLVSDQNFGLRLSLRPNFNPSSSDLRLVSDQGLRLRSQRKMK